jgi:MFS family permease
LALAFDASFQAVQWIVLAYLLAVTTLVVGVGRLGDLVGRRRLLLAGLALFTGASVLCGLAPALWVLIAARAVQGLGAAVMMALATAFVGDTVPQARTGSAMGLLGTMSAIGTALGPSVGGILLACLGWRALFLVIVPLGVLALLLAHRDLPADRPAGTTPRPAFDGVGTLLLALTLGAYALALTLGRGRLAALNLALLAGAAVGAVLFVRVEARTASPLIQLSMLRDRALGASLAANALVSTVMMATLVVGPFYLARALGLGPALVGLALSVGPLVAAVAGVPAGRLADRVGARRSTLVGLGGMALGVALLCALPATLRVVGYVGPIVVVTAGYAFFQTANNTAVMADVSADQRGVVAGMLGLSRNLGLVTGASVMGAVFALASGAADVATASPGAVATGMRITFGVAAALIVAALAISTRSRARRTTSAAVLVALAWTTTARGQSSTSAPHSASPTAADPYPPAAAGWGPPVRKGQFISRWAEDWTGARAAGMAPRLKAMPLGGEASLTLNAEARLRHDTYANALLTRGNDFRQTLFRGTLGTDLRLDRRLRLYGEVGSGQVAGRRRVAGPNFQNDASLQQLFIDARGRVGTTLLGAMVGRQELADGPRQLLSVSDGPNVHRTWNGVRLYAHGRRLRVGVFDLRVTRQARGAFDEAIDRAERLRGVNGSLLVARGTAGANVYNVYLDPFWIHSEHPAFRAAGRTGSHDRDERDTFGARLWGRRGHLAIDWTLARQVGRSRQRDVDAWGLFAVQSLALCDAAW